MKENYSNIVSHLKETIDGMEVIKTNNLQEKKKKQLDVLVSKLIQNNYSLGNLDIRLSTITEFIESMFLVVVLFMGSTLVLKGDISLGELIMFEYLIYFFLNPIKSVILTLPELQNFIVSLDRLNDIFESEEESDLQRKYDGVISCNKIEINHIYFSYNNEMDVLSDVSTLVRNGESLALVGESGSGKSTFAKLLVAFNQLYRGNILIDDINIDSIPLHILRKNIIYVPQNTFLFNGSVKNNLFLGDFIENDIYDILFACGIGGMDDDIDLDLVLCENGSNLSGGQRQRIAIARALILFPKVLILDEATCHIDKKREKQIMDFIKSTFCKRILIVITHDEKIAQECDKIIDFHKNDYLYGR